MNSTNHSKMKTNRKSLVYFPDWSRDNPYQKLLYRGLIDSGVPCHGLPGSGFTIKWLFENQDTVKFLHFHWLFGIYDPENNGLNWSKAKNFILRIIIAKSLGYKIIWTIHNFVSHEPSHIKLEILLRKITAQIADFVIVHCNYAKGLVNKEWHVQTEKIHVIPHGSYLGYYKNNVSRKEARDKLNLPQSDFVFLFFGMVRNYKGLKQLLSSFGDICTLNSRARLVIAGKPLNAQIAEELQNICGERISLFLQYIPDDEVQFFFNAADAVVLPYQNILTSGSALLALSFGRPLIVPNMGCIPELITQNNGFTYYHERELSETMLRALRKGTHEGFEQRCIDSVKHLDWDLIVKSSYLPMLDVIDIKQSIIIITNHIPQFDRASGCFRLYQIIKILAKKFHVIVYAEWFHKYYQKENDPYVKALLDIGVEVSLPQDNENSTKKKLLELLDRNVSAVIIEFFHIAEINLDIVRKAKPRLPIIVDSVDVHFYRMQMMAEITMDSSHTDKSIEIKPRELAVYAKADYVWAVSDLDKTILLKENPELKIQVIPNLHPVQKTLPSLGERRKNSLLFVGGFNHPPNTDAILFFCREIFPIIINDIPDVTLTIVGDSPPPEIQELSSDRILITGFVASTQPYLDLAYISIAPLRFGAGMKGKVGEALASGLPVVTTSIGAQGMRLEHKANSWIADTPQAFAEGIKQICLNDELHIQLSLNGQEHVRLNFSIEALETSLLSTINTAISHKDRVRKC